MLYQTSYFPPLCYHPTCDCYFKVVTIKDKCNAYLETILEDQDPQTGQQIEHLIVILRCPNDIFCSIPNACKYITSTMTVIDLVPIVIVHTESISIHQRTLPN